MHNILITDDIGPAGLALLDAATDVHYDVVKPACARSAGQPHRRLRGPHHPIGHAADRRHI